MRKEAGSQGKTAGLEKRRKARLEKADGGQRVEGGKSQFEGGADTNLMKGNGMGGR